MTVLAGTRNALIDRLKERGTYRRWVLVTVLVGMFATTFPVTILTVSLGDIASDFSVTNTTITWVIAAPMLASAVALPVLGKMGDLYGQRRVFLTGFALATLVAGTTAFAWSALALIGLRTLTQIIGAATQPTSMALIMRAFPAEERVKALGWWSLVGAGAPALGLAVGGPLVEAVGWRLVFAIQAGLAVVPVVVALLVLEESPAPGRTVRFDVKGALSLAVAAGSAMLALNQSADWGWTHPAVLVGVLIAPIAAVVFVRVERATEHPLIPLELIRRRNFSAPIISGFFGGGAYMGGFVLTPLLMRSLLGWSLSGIAFLMLLRPLTYSLSSPIGGTIGTRLGERRTAIAGSALLAIAMLIFAAGSFVESVIVLAGALVLQGVGNGIARPSITATIANAVEEEHLGMASASQRMLHQIGNAFGITILTAVWGGAPEAGAFARAYVVAFGLGAVATIAAASIRQEPPRSGIEITDIDVDRAEPSEPAIEGRP